MADDDAPFEFDRTKRLMALRQVLDGAIPHGTALRLAAVDCGPGWAILELPWDPQLVGDPQSGVLHGGAVTALLDQTCGMAVFMKLAKPTRIATLDLRIDYLGASHAGRPLLARAECYRLARHVAFARAEAYHEDPGGRTLVAASMGTFIVFAEGRSPMRDALDPEKP